MFLKSLFIVLYYCHLAKMHEFINAVIHGKRLPQPLCLQMQINQNPIGMTEDLLYCSVSRQREVPSGGSVVGKLNSRAGTPTVPVAGLFPRL